MNTKVILIVAIMILAISIISAICTKIKQRELLENKASMKEHFIISVITAALSCIITICSIPIRVPTDYSDNGGIMDGPNAVVNFGDSGLAQIWYTYDSSINPTKDQQFTGAFVPEKSGYIYYKAKFLWIESERGRSYIKSYQDVLKEAGTSEGSLPDGTINNPIEENKDIVDNIKSIETTNVSQSFMNDEDNSPGLVVWGWGDSSNTGEGRMSHTVEEINEMGRNGIWGDKIVFNTISNSTIGDEKNFVAARVDNGLNNGVENAWKSNLIEVDLGKEYYIRMYGHNNSPFDYNGVAENVEAQFLIPKESGRTIVVNGIIKSSNANPDCYWDSVVFTCKDRFHLEVVPKSALLENNGVGANGGKKLPMEIVNNWTTVGYSDLNGLIPGCYQYDFYITVKVRIVEDENM